MIELSDFDRGCLAGELGEAARMSMHILVTMTEVYGGERLLDIELAHIDGCLYHGDSGLEFAERLVAGGGRVRVPTTLNVGAFDQIHPENWQGDADLARRGKRLMECYTLMGCEPTFTCAPYQTPSRVPQPTLGQQVAWAESNAIVFANSVLGARTNRYGDFIDICAAITGRAPAVGLHLDEGRRGQVVIDLTRLPRRLVLSDVFYPVLGYWLGEWLAGQPSGARVPVLVGLPEDTSADRLKSLGAAAASSGALALFHAVGVTPEAPTLDAALLGRPAETTLVLEPHMLRQTLSALSTVEESPNTVIDVVALGSPHFSMAEFRQLLPLLERYPPSPSVEVVVCTSRFVGWALEEKGFDETLRRLGVRLVVDTCVVVAPILETKSGVLMTNSGKFAHYTPGNLGFEVMFGSLEECVRSAAQGSLWRDVELWTYRATPGDRGNAS